MTEVGGLMTHGAVIAREYGLPAVVGVERPPGGSATGSASASTEPTGTSRSSPEGATSGVRDPAAEGQRDVEQADVDEAGSRISPSSSCGLSTGSRSRIADVAFGMRSAGKPEATQYAA